MPDMPMWLAEKKAHEAIRYYIKKNFVVFLSINPQDDATCRLSVFVHNYHPTRSLYLEFVITSRYFDLNTSLKERSSHSYNITFRV